MPTARTEAVEVKLMEVDGRDEVILGKPSALTDREENVDDGDPNGGRR